MRNILGLGALLLAATVVPGVAVADHTAFLVGSNASTEYGDAVHLTAELFVASGDCFNNVCPFGGQQVDFYVDGAFVGTDITDNAGIADLLVASPDWHVGTHAIRAQYDRFSNPSNPATAGSTLTVTKEATGTVAARGYLQATLTDDDGAALVGAPVRFHVVRTVDTPAGSKTVDQDICTAYTDAAGLAKCVPVTGAGLSQLNNDATRYTASFDGSSDYVASSGSANLV